MKFLKELRDSGRTDDMQAVLDSIPYARFMGVEVDVKGNELTTVLPYSNHLVGNVNLPALHGGALGAFLEITAVTQLLLDTSLERLPRTVDFSVDYLRSARPVPSYGRAIVTKHGRHVANVRAEVWQDERARPVTIGHGHFLLTPLD